MSDDNNDGNGVADLRKQYEAIKKERDALATENATFKAGQRTATVGEILKAKGLTAEHAEFYTADDVSEGAVNAWVESKRALFGVPDSAADANAAAAERAAGVSHGNVGSIQAGTTSPALGDPEAIMNAIKTLPYEDLVKLGYMPKENTLFSPKR